MRSGLVITPWPRLARITRRRIRAVGVAVEIDAHVIARGTPVEHVSHWIVDLLTGPCLAAMVGEEFSGRFGPAEDPCCGRW